MIRPPPSSTLFPTPPLSRSAADPSAPATLLTGSGPGAEPAAAATTWPDDWREKFANGDEKLLGRLKRLDRKSTRLNSSHQIISYAVFCLKKKKKMLKHHHVILTPDRFCCHQTTDKMRSTLCRQICNWLATR